MTVRCPVCGAKLNTAQMCPYCQGVTLNRILNASNKKAKEKLKHHQSQDVFTSSTLPGDVNKKALWIFAILLGWAGAHHFYVGRLYKGLFYALSFGLLLVSVAVQMILEKYAVSLSYVVNNISVFFAFFAAISFLLWLSDLFALLFHAYKVPVVLGEETIIEPKKKGKK